MWGLLILSGLLQHNYYKTFEIVENKNFDQLNIVYVLLRVYISLNIDPFTYWPLFLGVSVLFLNNILSKLYAPFYGWGSAASRLQSHFKEIVYSLLLSSHKFLVLIWSTSEDERLISQPWINWNVLSSRSIGNRVP